MPSSQTLPILYSLRNCPYVMRARLAIFKAEITVELRDVVLKQKPAEMLQASPKGSVPVLVLASGKVIDESLDIMLWALKSKDPHDLLAQHAPDLLPAMLALIDEFDQQFKEALEAYKCAKRYHETNIVQCRNACLVFIEDLERRLNQTSFLMAEHETLLDIALLPFIRQFSKVERQWYLQAPYPKLRLWLNRYIQSATFTKVMAKFPLWQANMPPTVFSAQRKRQ